MVTNPFVNNNKCSRFDHAKTCINTWTFPLKCEGQSRGSGRLFEGGYYFKYLAHGGGGERWILGVLGRRMFKSGGYARTSTVVARPNPTHPCLFTPALYPGPYGQPSVEPRPNPSIIPLQLTSNRCCVHSTQSGSRSFWAISFNQPSLCRPLYVLFCCYRHLCYVNPYCLKF